MRIQGWKRGAAAGALAAALATPAVAGAATAPRGEVVADDALGVPLVDASSDRIVFPTGLTTFAIVDPAAMRRSSADVAGVCALPERQPPQLQAVAGGAALVICDVQRPAADGPVPGPRVISLDDGRAHVPAGLEKVEGRAREFDGPTITFGSGGYKDTPYVERRLDWRTGQLVGRLDAPGPLEGLRIVVELGRRTVDSTRPLTVALPACGAALTWEVGALASASRLADAVLVADAARGGGPWTLTRVPLSGACERTVGRWGAATATGGGRKVAPVLISATVDDPESGAIAGADPVTAKQAVIDGLPALRVRPGARVRFAPAQAAASVRLKVGGGRWQAARGSGRSWALAVSPRLRGTREATVETRLADGGVVRHALRLTGTGSRR